MENGLGQKSDRRLDLLKQIGPSFFYALVSTQASRGTVLILLDSRNFFSLSKMVAETLFLPLPDRN